MQTANPDLRCRVLFTEPKWMRKVSTMMINADTAPDHERDSNPYFDGVPSYGLYYSRKYECWELVLPIPKDRVFRLFVHPYAWEGYNHE